MAVLTFDARDREESLRNRDRLRLLLEVSEAVASHGDLTALFRDLARRLPAIVPFEVIALFLHDPAKNVMRVHMIGTAEADRRAAGLGAATPDESYSGEVFRTQQPLVVRQPRGSDGFPNSRALIARRSASSPSACCRSRRSSARSARLDSAAGARTRSVTRSSSSSVSSRVRSRSPSTTCCTTRAIAPAQATSSQERDRLRLLLEVSESIALVPRPARALRGPEPAAAAGRAVRLHQPRAARSRARRHAAAAPRDRASRPRSSRASRRPSTNRPPVSCGRRSSR